MKNLATTRAARKALAAAIDRTEVAKVIAEEEKKTDAWLESLSRGTAADRRLAAWLLSKV